MTNSTYDSIVSTPAHVAGKSAFAILDGLQNLHHSQQVVGASYMLLLLCKKHQLDPAEVMQATARMLNDGVRDNNIHTRAIYSYLRMEVPNDNHLF